MYLTLLYENMKYSLPGFLLWLSLDYDIQTFSYNYDVIQIHFISI